MPPSLVSYDDRIWMVFLPFLSYRALKWNILPFSLSLFSTVLLTSLDGHIDKVENVAC